MTYMVYVYCVYVYIRDHRKAVHALVLFTVRVVHSFSHNLRKNLLRKY